MAPATQAGAAPPRATAVANDEPLVSVQLSASDLELIERSLKALGHAPGFDYSHILAARALAERLSKMKPADGRRPVTSH